MADTTTEIRTEARPYKPSWLDRLTDWVGKLPVPEWIFYGVLGLLLIAVQLLFLWWEGGLHLGSLLPVIIYNALAVPYSLALIHLLDNQAVTALNSMRPTLEITEPDFNQVKYRLSTMPSGVTLVVGLSFAAFLVLSERLGNVPIRYVALDDLPVFTIVYHLIDKSTAFVAGGFVYHSIAQLRLVNAIYCTHARINLFDIKPLYAFSKLTASTALGLLVTVYGWMLINPELLAAPLGVAGTVAFTILAVAVFVWPLLGAHRLMAMERERMLHELELQFEAVFARFNQRLRDDDYSSMEALSGTIASLEIQQRKVVAIPTWPWRPETVRSVLTAIVLPLALRIIQFVVDQAFDW